ncbi:hypothetical protein IU438_19120 [Nocardia cyriacigeorgica]|uniref:hypothetical protein n=1 Tax=Nocardia cyriacigeorgica TaxID=135487 RepID=UPI0018938558|nr:hypothetical protein [Nocardia cyriacigeorgica]MBF6397906.1 hypothetical protein [Nocardia cyriacigeorgica]MBF6402437.1 hypothetical protein [Nocardia cyriacigeorgica]
MYTLDPDRRSFLQTRAKTNVVRVPAWPRADKNLPEVELPIQWVRFSILNHRTKAEQQREMRAAGRDDLFAADPLGDETQDLQYRILCGQPGFDDLKADLKERGQQEPAIITADGVLINGNRRAAALRSLWTAGDPAGNYLVCLVLPADATLEELVDLEAELQVANAFKENYSWINEAMLIEELYDRSGKNWDHVASRMHRTVADVRGKYDKLQQVHQLVELSDGMRQYMDFVDNESVFDELAKHVKNKSPKEADAVRAVYFLGALTGTPYRKLRHLRRADAAALVRDEIYDDAALRPILDAAEASAAVQDCDDPLADLLGEPAALSPLHDLLAFVAKKRPESSVALDDGQKVQLQDVLKSIGSSIAAAADEAKEDDRDQSALVAPIIRVDKAIAELQRALDCLPKARAFDDWDEVELAERIGKLERLIAKVSVIR